MSIYRNKEGEGFAALAASQGWGRNRQIRELNRIYNGKVVFGKWYGEYNYSGEYAICVEWTSDDIEDLECGDQGRDQDKENRRCQQRQRDQPELLEFSCSVQRGRLIICP